MARLPNFLVIIRSEKLSGKGQGRGAKKRTFRFGKKNVSFPKVETFRFADYKYYTPADYTEGSELDKLVKTIIDTTASNEKLMAVHYINKQEQVSHNGQIDNKEDKEKEKLIMDLENSNSFKQTHSIISELKKIKNWTLEEKKQLKIIAEKNKQISYIMKDGDVASFYSSLE